MEGHFAQISADERRRQITSAEAPGTSVPRPHVLVLFRLPSESYGSSLVTAVVAAHRGCSHAPHGYVFYAALDCC
jgi:hypothetical protein